jgi:hypothetical protein
VLHKGEVCVELALLPAWASVLIQASMSTPSRPS